MIKAPFIKLNSLVVNIQVIKGYLLLVAILALLPSCISIKDLGLMKSSKVNAINEIQLNGIYENKPESTQDEERGDDLKKLLFLPFYVYEWDEERNYSNQIGIEFLSKKKVKISYLVNGKVLETKILKGKFKNEFFLLRRKVRPLEIPFVFFNYKERRVMFGLNEEGELIVKTGKFDLGTVLLFAGGEKMVTQYRFKKKR